MHGDHYELVRYENWSRQRLYKSEDLTSIAQFIAEKDAPHRSSAVPDGGQSWRDRIPESMEGED
jgi:hypothetical protein